MPDLSSYRSVASIGSLAEADSHEVITVMLGSVLSRIAQARGCIERGETAGKGEQIGKALGVVEGLMLSLDAERGGEIAGNLERLYDYISRSLLRANLDDDIALLDEVSTLVREIKSGWEAIPVEVRR
jgi:flagellar protein FliS